MRILRTLKYFVIIMTALLLTACGLPSDVKKQTDEIPGRIEAVGKEISGKKDNYTKLKGSDQFKFFAPYAKNENWSAFFTEAEDELKRAKVYYDSKVMPIRKRNKEDDATAIRIEIAQVNRIIASAVKSSKKTAARMGFLEAVKKEAPKMVEKAEKDVVKSGEIIESLDGLIASAKTEYPNKADEIAGKYAPLNKLHKDAQDALIISQAEFKLHESGKAADYSKLGDGTVLADTNLNKIISLDKALRPKIGELYQSYTKILKDMRIDYYVQVGRVSWDESSDFAKETNYIYPARKVGSEVHEYFAKLKPETVPAKYQKFWGESYKIYVVKDKWNILNIQPKESWPSSFDDHAEFWIEDVSVKTYQKYLIVQNGERKETGWVNVDEEDYEENIDNLGMEIVSKPYGYFEEDKLEEAAPPGMSNVGNPKYGKWVTNSSGQRQWGWFEHYMFYNLMFGGSSRNYYSYNGWNSWNNDYRGREPYYGRNTSGGQKYGTHGSSVRTSPKYNKTSFARKGGFKRPVASIRGAGPSSRGGGPGGRGK
ncbi:MAG: hypothetical protein U9R34_02585 [Nanoarchaeota archaeon]|nr:hypothetical protein [Nanoarchaeota archaeon]